jgi:hypothetical protein
MISPEQDIAIKNFWDNMSQIDKLNLLLENNFWEGFSVYRYDYIPEDLKEILMRKMKVNEANSP